MKVKILKLIPYTEPNKKFKTATVTVDNQNYLMSPTPIDQKGNYVGMPLIIHLTCSITDLNTDVQYLKCDIKIEKADTKEIFFKDARVFNDIKKAQLKRFFVISFVPIFKGQYKVQVNLACRAKQFVQSSLPLQQKRDTFQQMIECQDPFDLEENIIYDEKPSAVSFPLFVQYVLKNKIRQTLEVQAKFVSQFFNHTFLNESSSVKLKPMETYYLMLQVNYRNQNKKQALFRDKAEMLGTMSFSYAKCQFEKKLILKPGFKHLLFKAQSLDRKVPKKDIVQVRVKFSNIYQIQYNMKSIRISIDQKQIPAGIKILKISNDKIDLNRQSQEIVIFTLICLRGGLFKLKGIVLSIQDQKKSDQERPIKYINDITLMVQNESDKKQQQLMEKTTTVQIDSLL